MFGLIPKNGFNAQQAVPDLGEQDVAVGEILNRTPVSLFGDGIALGKHHLAEVLCILDANQRNEGTLAGLPGCFSQYWQTL
ncbi:MAG: hypothetical protein ACFE0O_12510 [Opitutales bacterium]